MGQVQHFAHSIVDEDEADEGTETFLSEAGEVTHQHAGLCGYQCQAKDGHPDAHPQAKGQVVQAVISVGVRDKQGSAGLSVPPPNPS